MSQRLKLDHLIDLEMQLHRDADVDAHQRRQRDAAIGRQIGADQLDGKPLYLAWLAELRKQWGQSGGASPGHQVRQFLALIGLTLGLLGALLGAATVTGWLRINPAQPVNALYFWCFVVGVQILLLCGWLLAVLPIGWLERLPAIGGLRLLLQLLARLLPVAMAWGATRISDDSRQLLREIQAAAARLDWLYGRIRFWYLIQLTQVFAVAYNVGAIVAFVLATHGNDPAFSWRSTNLENDTVHRMTRLIAMPWSGYFERATLRAQDIEATRYSSFDQQYWDAARSTPATQQGWKRWSLLLLASLVTYGLLPRCGTLLVARLSLHWAVNRVELDHTEFQRLRDRLKQPFVELYADQSEPPPPSAEPSDDRPAALPAIRSGEGPYPALRCDGVELSDEQIRQVIRARFGKPVTSVFPVLGLQYDLDQAALNQIAQVGAVGEVFVLVEAWRPPVGEYVDLLTSLRSQIGERRMINVLLYDRDGEGKSIEPKPRHAQMWRAALATVGDPWLRIEPLVEEPVT